MMQLQLSLYQAVELGSESVGSRLRGVEQLMDQLSLYIITPDAGECSARA